MSNKNRYNGKKITAPECIDYSKMSKQELLKLAEKASILVNEWTESVVLMGAELFIVCPQHEIFSSNYFVDNTKLMMFNRAVELLPICKHKRIIYEDDNGKAVEVDPENIIKVVENYRNKLNQ